jgi:hypothetical protein
MRKALIALAIVAVKADLDSLKLQDEFFERPSIRLMSKIDC